MSKTEERVNKVLANLSTMDLKSSLANVAQSMVVYHFTRFVLPAVRTRIPEQFKIMVDSIDAREPKSDKLITQWVLDETHPCPVCGKVTLKQQECDSRECQGKNPRVKEARADTCEMKFGTRNCFQADICKEKSKSTMMQKYGVEYSSKRDDWRNKVETTNEAKFGHKWASQSPDIRTRINNTIITRFGSMENYKKYIADVMAETHERLKQDPSYTFGVSKGEKDIFDWIPLDDKESNDRTLIKPLELYMVIPSHKLAIEYDGLYWHTESKRGKTYHLDKTEFVENQGYQLLHIWDNEPADIWKSIIQSKLGLNVKIAARKCAVKTVNDDDAVIFLNENHMQGFCRAKVKLGLYYNDDLVQIMTFSKPRYNSHYKYELIRMCSKQGLTIVGGASKLFAYFIRNYQPKSIISYANRRWSTGSVYETLGFKLDHISPPAYCYYKQTKCYSRQKFMKHKLVAEGYDPNKTEAQIMKERGFEKVYDCGNLVFVWTRD